MASQIDKIKLLHNILTRNYGQLDVMIADYLKAGTDLLQLELGICSQVNGEEYRVIGVSQNSFGVEVGALFPLKDTYCREVFAGKKTVSVSEAGSTEPYKSHPVYENLKLESYLSTPLYVQGDIYGTLNFSSQSIRSKGFSEEDYEIIELMGDSLGSVIGAKIQGEKIEVLNKKLTYNEKMASLGRMAGGVAHEINNPLAIILGCAEAIDRLEPNEEERKNKYTEKIRDTVSRIGKIVEGLIDFSGDRWDSPPENIQVKKSVDLICDWATSSQPEIKIRNLVSKRLQAHCNHTHLEKAILNLFKNSIEAVRDVEKKWIEIDGEFIDGFVRLKISDSGDGIDLQTKSSIFDPFFSTKPVGHNPGLGLSVAKGLIEMNNGQLYWDSDQEKTTFIIEIPKAT